MINSFVNNRSCETVNQNRLGQFGTINVPVSLVILALCMEMGENNKTTNYTMNRRMQLSFQLLGLQDKPKNRGS